MAEELASLTASEIASHLRKAVSAGQFGIPAEEVGKLWQMIGELQLRAEGKRPSPKS